MSQESETLAELILHADQYCARVEMAVKDVAPSLDEKELRAKIGQCRAQIAFLQTQYENDQLSLETPSVSADFRHLITALMWIAFYSRTAIDFKTFRMLVRIESFFTFLLITRQE